MKDKLVIIGTGIAAVSAIKAFREIDKDSPIDLFGQEDYYPYTRIKLSKTLLNRLQENQILIQKKEWYQANNVSVHLSKKITHIDPGSKIIHLQDGSQWDYTKLLLATGASNRCPPIEGIRKQGVFTLRTLDNAKEIINHLDNSKVILIIGGGIQGLELAWILSQAGKKVVISELASRLMPKQLDSRASALLKDLITQKQIKLLLDTSIEALTGSDKVEGCILSNGTTIPCDTVLYSIGIKPNIDILKETTIKLNQGVIINSQMETNIPGVYAAGDVAEWENHLYGLWPIALEQGKIAGYNLAGKNSYFKSSFPVTTLNAFNTTLFTMGIIDENKADYLIIDEALDKSTYSKIFIKDRKIIGTIMLGYTKESLLFRTAIDNELDLGNIDYKTITLRPLMALLKDKKSK